jgi:hypothetical protein
MSEHTSDASAVFLNSKVLRRSFIGACVKTWAATAILGQTVIIPSKAQSGASEPIPKFHDHLPDGPLPQVRDHEQYADKPPVQRIYQLASGIRPVLYQLPCYCSCDHAEGHTSLLDCFVGEHGVECKICQREVVFAFRETRRGRSPKKIRASVIKREWQHEEVDDLKSLPEA